MTETIFRKNVFDESLVTWRVRVLWPILQPSNRDRSRCFEVVIDPIQSLNVAFDLPLPLHSCYNTATVYNHVPSQAVASLCTHQHCQCELMLLTLAGQHLDSRVCRALFRLFPQTGNCHKCWLLTKQKYHIIPMVLNYWLTNLVQSWRHPSDFFKAP